MSTTDHLSSFSVPGAYPESPIPTVPPTSHDKATTSATTSPRPIFLTHAQGQELLDTALLAMRSSIRLPYTDHKMLQAARESLTRCRTEAEEAIRKGKTDDESQSLLDARVDTNLQSILDTGAGVMRRNWFGHRVEMDPWAGGMKVIGSLKEQGSTPGAQDDLNSTCSFLQGLCPGQDFKDLPTFTERPPAITSPLDAAYWAYDTAGAAVSGCQPYITWAGDTAWSLGENAYSAICDTVKTAKSYISDAVTGAYRWMWPEQKETTALGLRTLVDRAEKASSLQRGDAAQSKIQWVGHGEGRKGPWSGAKAVAESWASSMGLLSQPLPPSRLLL